ncbi:MAG TPA: hypothetical protein VGL33_07695 [Streptosporangiaceae bacterium]|nr:hypothetical protein [Frankiaceae bacterium]
MRRAEQTPGQATYGAAHEPTLLDAASYLGNGATGGGTDASASRSTAHIADSLLASQSSGGQLKLGAQERDIGRVAVQLSGELAQRHRVRGGVDCPDQPGEFRSVAGEMVMVSPPSANLELTASESELTFRPNGPVNGLRALPITWG